MARSIRQMARDVLGKDRVSAIETAVDRLHVGEKLIITRGGGNDVRLALVRGGKTVHSETGPMRVVFESAMRLLDPLTLDGVRKVRAEPDGPKVN